MKYIKPAKKSKVRLYVSKDMQTGDILDIQLENIANNEHWLDGNLIGNWIAYSMPQADKARIITNKFSLVKNFGYEEMEPFVFSAKLYFSGEGKRNENTDVVYLNDMENKIDKRIATFLDKGSRPHSFRAAMTTPGLLWLFNLAAINNRFNIYQDKDLDGNHVMAVTGWWIVDTKAKTLSILPYTDD